MSSLPLVSCIMPTRNRRLFVGQSIWYFLRQEYPQCELIIVDDGEDAVADLVPSDPRIRYVHLGRRVPLGAKRNIACEMSRGELIAHWDDDDWIAPNRLNIQVSHLLSSGADVCGIRDLLHYRLEAGDAWLYRCPPGERPGVAGCTLLYRRAAWAEHRFAEINVGEDSAFVFQLPPDRIHAVDDSSCFIALIHARNTGVKNVADPHWERRPMFEVSNLLAFDRDYYVALRNKRPVEYPTLSRSLFSTINLIAPITCSTGYGSMAEYLAVGLARAGAAVNIVPLSLNTEGLSEEFQDLLRRSRPDRTAPALYFHWIRSDIEQYRTSGNLFVYTMWESSRLPEGWAEQINNCRAVMVPTRFVARICRESGVTVPIEVVPQGVDPEVYHYEDRPERAGLTTLMVCPVDNRKHTLVGIAAWKQAFANDPEARLIIKTNYDYHNYTPDDTRIQYIDRNEPTRGIAHWYRQADVLLAIGNEGFGLPLVEGMATGLPVIALTSEGQGDVFEEAREYLLPIEPARWEAYCPAPFGPAGVRGVPDAEDVARQLHWVISHRAEARTMGRAASDWVLRHRNIWSKGPAALDVMERHLQPPRPLRKAPTLWVPSWHTTCGIAEYTAHLTKALSRFRVTAQPPVMRGTWLLHVQHEHNLFNNAELAHQVQQARQLGVPVIITEHTVTADAHAWERDANILVALSQDGTDMLRSRWPTKCIQHIPLGCPTWFPRRKQSRGKVIGTFGFLERYKGFWRLLEVLRELRGSELLMFSYAKYAEMEESWTEASTGLPVRREREFLPIEEIVHRLAAEADILVFWYDQHRYAAASYAVRIGLATGVPVLTSPTNWFSDLREVTYQPDNLIDGVHRLLEDTPLREQLTARARDYCHDHSWPRIAERHLSLWQTLDGI